MIFAVGGGGFWVIADPTPAGQLLFTISLLLHLFIVMRWLATDH